MTDILSKCAVRIEAKNGFVCGTGFLVEKDKVITCAHVVQDALHVHAGEVPQGEVIVVSHGKKIQACVHENGWHISDDIAVLCLKDVPPDEAKAALLSRDSFSDLLNRPVRSLGFPEGYAYDGVCAADWKIKGRNIRHIQIEYDGRCGIPVLPGFSGAPVLDTHSGKIAGMIVKAEENVDKARVAFMIPADILTEKLSICNIFLILSGEREMTTPVRSEREICEEFLNNSFSQDDKHDLISICKNRFPKIKNKISIKHDIDEIIYMLLEYIDNNAEFPAFWTAMEIARPNKHNEFLSKLSSEQEFDRY
jgi:hypothetical protein